ncbi:HDOD domain-containing protein [Aestuariirhabdus sp. Z084]|uniref:HDOD domain-containing protein n=1 Tax=Aestuariirhabdus haliotis TaxID=2918751 RepID=UPI00201B39B0|nr:HDOD domain-containing protein [Aestuariirhabdus haliotis]MCL6417140.1 HDOD domain-containing protein [Aestuariirhabdus haliotis]MCL6421128.1 HDOD domain-containing protein [Aestuariirhabdus haliotis]
MPIATRVKRYFQSNGARVKVHRLSSPVLSLCDSVVNRGIDPSAVAIARVYEHAQGASLLIYPLTHRVGDSELTALLGDDAKRIGRTEVAALFDDCSADAVPPIGAPYNLKVLMDPALLIHETIYFHAGCPQTLIAADQDEFRFLNPGALVARFSEAGCTDAACPSSAGLESAICRKLHSFQRLPPMPDNVSRILTVVNDPESTVSQLAGLVSSDPSLSLQVMRYARSALFAYPGKVETVEQAITRVLGFDLVGNMVLGLAACESLRMPDKGPLSVTHFWRNSLFCAELARVLSKKLDPALNIEPGTAYLAGMLHHFGIILLSHLFPSEYRLLCRLVEREPEKPIFELEKRVMGFGQARDILTLGYGKIGGWLLDEWNMPGELVVCAMHHTEAGFSHQQQPYVALIQLVNYLLTINQIEYATLDRLDDSVCLTLGITVEEAQAELDKILESNQSIEQLISTMVA